MLAIPARIAGCPVRVLCTPPRRDGRPIRPCSWRPGLCGIEQVFKVGGAQAVAAMAYGTASVPKVGQDLRPGQRLGDGGQADRRDGCARRRARHAGRSVRSAGHRRRSARPEFVAADLLSQAEHSEDAQVVLVTTSRVLAVACVAEVERQMAALPRRADHRALDRREPRAGRRGPRDGTRGQQSLRARAPDRAGRVAARLARPRPQCRLGVPRRVDAGDDGRLLQRHQPRAADLRLRARLQRAWRDRFRQAASPCRKSRRPGSRDLGLTGTHAGAPRGTGRARARPSRCASTRLRGRPAHESRALARATGHPATAALPARDLGSVAGAHARQRDAVARAGRRTPWPDSTAIRNRSRGRSSSGWPGCTTCRPGACWSAGAATKRSTCWCGPSAAQARTASSSARPPSASTRSPRGSRARPSSRCRCCAPASRSMRPAVIEAGAPRQDRVPVLAEQSDRQPAGRRADVAGCAANWQPRARLRRRGLRRICRAPEPDGAARRVAEPGRAADPVEGLCARRRAARHADRRRGRRRAC